jgi:hypothetical protein
VNSFSRRHLFGAAGALVTVSALGAEAWAAAKDRLVIGMSLEPPLLDPTKNAAAAIREVTTPSIFESLGRIDRTGAVRPASPRAGASRRTARNISSSCARA